MSLRPTDSGEGVLQEEMARGAQVTVEGIALTAELGGLQSLLREPIRSTSYMGKHSIHCTRWLSSRTMVCVDFTYSPLPRPVWCLEETLTISTACVHTPHRYMHIDLTYNDCQESNSIALGNESI